MSTAPNPNFALASFGQSGTYSDDSLLADGHGVTSAKGTLASGGGFVLRGTIMKMDMATGALSVADGGTALANVVVAENADATSATAQVLVYLTGRMKSSGIIWPAAGSHAAHAESLRDVGIYIESVMRTSGQTLRSAGLTAEAEAADIKAIADRAEKAAEKAAEKEKADAKKAEPDEDESKPKAPPHDRGGRR